MSVTKTIVKPDMFLIQKIRDGFYRINDSFGQAVVNGKTFQLSTLHIKSPSEHAIMGGGFPAELQLRGSSEDGELITFVSLIEKGEKSKMFEKMGFGGGEFKKLDVTGWEGEGELTMNELDLNEIKKDKYFIYYKGAETEKKGCALRHYYISVDTLSMDES